jgi:hypothetical protein
MNEYQQRDATKYQKSLGRLHLIVEELNALDLGDVTEFEIQPIPDDCDYSPRYIAISALIQEGPIEIMCERDGYGSNDRWEFRASGWPTYTDENGKTEVIDPSNLFSPRASRPTTTAAQDRAPKAIAKQIAGKVIPEYIETYKRCLGRAEEAQAYSDKSTANADMVAEAAKDEGHHIGRRGRAWYVKGLKGDTLCVEMKSADNFGIEVSAREMVAVIGLVREMRA